MKKFFILSVFALISFSFFVSSCGIHEESLHSSFGMGGFGFFGGVISTLLLIVLVLLIINFFGIKMKGGKL